MKKVLFTSYENPRRYSGRVIVSRFITETCYSTSREVACRVLPPDTASTKSILGLQGGLAISMYERMHPEMLINFNKSNFCLKFLLLLLTVTPVLIEKEKKKKPLSFLHDHACAAWARFLPLSLFSRPSHIREVRNLSTSLGSAVVSQGKTA